MKNPNALNDILGFVSRYLDSAARILVHDDYTLQTDVGCFRVAYSKETHSVALFSARHPADLAAAPDATSEFGIAHKDKVRLLRIYKVYHAPNLKLNKTDDRQQFDLSWLRREIPTYVHDIPRINFREANLHADGPSVLSSVFVSYHFQPSTEVPGEFNVDIKTKTSSNFRLLRFDDDLVTPANPRDQKRNFIIRAWHAAASSFKRHCLASISFPLRTFDPVTKTSHTVFAEKTVRDAAEADFNNRLLQIRRGQDPVKWRESPLLPVYRAAPALLKKARDFTSLEDGGYEGIARRVGVLGLHVFLEGGIDMLTGFLEDSAGDFAVKEKLLLVPREWEPIVDKGARRLHSIDSLLHRRLITPDPTEFRDLAWIHPKNHLANFATNPGSTQTPTPAKIFQMWLTSYFFNPSSTSIEYRGDNYQLLAIDDVSKIKVMKFNVSNGLVIYFAEETGKLYAYYNTSDYIGLEPGLPADAKNYLKADQVIEIDLNDREAGMTMRPFAAFDAEIRRLTSATSPFKLQSAKVPLDEEIKTTVSSPTTSRPPNPPDLPTWPAIPPLVYLP